MEKYIDQLPVERWEEYKNLYIEAVKSDPQAFGETVEEMMEVKDSEWQEELKEVLDKKSVMIFAELDGRLIGLGSASFHKREKLKHNAFLASLFVLKEHRGMGIGKKLTEKRIEKVLKNKDIKNIHCEIVKNQVASIELHKKLGFYITGEIRKLICHGGEYLDEYWLTKSIDRS